MERRDGGPEYEIRLRGRFDDQRCARFNEFNDHLEVSETVLRGRMADTAELHGVLDRLQDLGFDLLEVRPTAWPGRQGQRR
jgi:hypothetical protein